VNQIITLLSNLFSLTKVASVTLPGLLAAGGLALILWPAVPVDLIPLAVRSEQQIGDFDVPPDATCQGESTLGRHSAYDAVCSVRFLSMGQILESIGPGKSVPDGLGEIAQPLSDIQQQRTYSQFRKQQIQQQLVLDFDNQKFSECINLETSLKGREATENLQLKADLDIEEKQRSAAQDNYLAYLKSNNRSLAGHYQWEMNNFQGCITLKRYSVLWNERDILERERRLVELAREQNVITSRLADPGRLRPRLGFDDFMTGLVNHVVAFILLSLAAAIVVAAIDRAAFFGALFEDLFDGF